MPTKCAVSDALPIKRSQWRKSAIGESHALRFLYLLDNTTYRTVNKDPTTSSLFTNVPIKKSIEIIQDKVPENLVPLIQHCLNTNYFIFQGTYYEQVSGAAMGSPISPVVADIYMEYLENYILNNAPLKPSQWFRATCISEQENLANELEHIRSTLQQNGYSKHKINRTIDRLTNHTTKPTHNHTTDTHDKEHATTFLPYIQGTTDRIGRILRKHNIRTVFTTHTKIGQLLTSPKDPQPQLSTPGKPPCPKTLCVMHILREEGHEESQCWTKQRAIRNREGHRKPAVNACLSNTCSLTPVVIRDVTLRCLLDSGAECSLIREDTAQHIGCRVVPLSGAVQGLGGQRVKTIGRIIETLRFQDTAVELELLVVPDFQVAPEVIIGKNVLKRKDLKMVTDATGSRLECGANLHEPVEPSSLSQCLQLTRVEDDVRGPLKSLLEKYQEMMITGNPERQVTTGEMTITTQENKRTINTALGNLRNNIALVYVDDILIPSQTIEEGLERLDQVLNALTKAGFSLNIKKCKFFQTTVEYLGREVSAAGIRPSKEKIKALLESPVPTSVKQVRQFMGLASYFRKFIPSFSVRTAPITKLTKSNTTWEWGKEQEDARQYIVEKLISNPLLVIFDPERETELHTDCLQLTRVEDDVRGPLKSLLEKYQEMMITGNPERQVTTGEMTITTQENKVISYNPYRLAYTERERVRALVDTLLKDNIIRESTSPFASPAILIKKKDGSNRLCVDFRELNKITIRDRYPLPLIDDQLDRLGKGKYFTTLDMLSGFHQIPIAPDSICKTAFVTPDGHYEYLRMPFGLTNAPAVFQRTINTALGNLRNNIALVYVDDILIPSQTIEGGLDTLDQVLNALTKAGFSLNIKKIKFFQTTVEYLGREVSAAGIRPSKEKIKALLESPVPTSVKQVRQFMGLASYFRKFIPSFSVLRTAPITKLTKSNTTWEWGKKQEDARQYIVEKLISNPLLVIFNPERETELHTDASAIGYGGILFPNLK
nr:PREDICTED: LOW QUALITY PROTEIN: uncharacterized protein LOC105663013 [Megachile rotundata]